uniref:Uncharacterized protein n=1 Tax=Amphimedon queenslandica TaxID=400682 RepID=A0A1X7U4A5_AMPQE
MKFTILALFLMSFILVDAVGYKKYCKNKKYLVNGKDIPHLHCEKDAFMLTWGSKKNKRHAYFVQSNVVRCNKLNEVLNDPGRYRFNKVPAIEEAMIRFGVDEECFD